MPIDIYSKFRSRLPKNYENSAMPLWASNSTVVINQIACRSFDNQDDLIKDSPSILNTALTGAGGLLQSVDLAGTAACSGTTITGVGTNFTSSFIVGDVIFWPSTNEGRRITTIASDTSMSVETPLTQAAATYRRGGLAIRTPYLIYAVKSDVGVVSIAGSTRNIAAGDTMVDLPAGNWKYQLIGRFRGSQQAGWFITTDSNKNILPFSIVEGRAVAFRGGNVDTRTELGNGLAYSLAHLAPKGISAVRIYAFAADLGAGSTIVYSSSVREGFWSVVDNPGGTPSAWSASEYLPLAASDRVIGIAPTGGVLNLQTRLMEAYL